MEIITADLIKSHFPIRDENSHKGCFGSLLNISGAMSMAGAAMMSTLAAMRVGVGITRLAAPLEVAKTVAPHLMEAMTFSLLQTPDGAISSSAQKQLLPMLTKSTACLIGCGLSVCDDTKRIVEFVLNNTVCKNIVLDADALNCISQSPILQLLLKESEHNIILTPHIGEFSRLIKKPIDEIVKNSEKFVSEFAVCNNVVLVLKGRETLICDKNGDIYKNQTGNCSLAKGGSGDVLAGMTAGFMAQSETISPLEAAMFAVFFHGLCADTLAKTRSNYSILARDIIEQIAFEIKNLQNT